jgi:hypothetical protein
VGEMFFLGGGGEKGGREGGREGGGGQGEGCTCVRACGRARVHALLPKLTSTSAQGPRPRPKAQGCIALPRITTHHHALPRTTHCHPLPKKNKHYPIS